MTSSARPLAYSFFMMDTPSHISQGMWRHPESRASEYNNLSLWVSLAVRRSTSRHAAAASALESRRQSRWTSRWSSH